MSKLWSNGQRVFKNLVYQKQFQNIRVFIHLELNSWAYISLRRVKLYIDILPTSYLGRDSFCLKYKGRKIGEHCAS